MKKSPLYEVRKITDLKDMLRQSAVLYKDTAAFKIKETKGGPYVDVSYEKFSKDVEALGTALIHRFGTNNRIAIYAETRYEWYLTYMATVNGAGIIVPLDKEQPQAEIISLLSRSRANVLAFSDVKQKEVEQMKDSIPGVEIFIQMDGAKSDHQLSFTDLLKEGYDLLDAGDTKYASIKIDPETMSILLFTSGTTDKSKAVMLSHKNICANLMDMCAMKYIGPKDVFLSVLPLHHTYECTCGFICPIYRGSTVAVCEGLRYITQNMKEAGVTLILVVPLMLEMFHRSIMKKAKADIKATRKFKFAVRLTRFLRKIGIDKRRKIFKAVHDNFGGKLNTIICGGASINPTVMSDMRDMGFACLQGYGLTECAPILALNRDVEYNDSSAGLPLPHCEVKIIQADEDGIGEIIGKGPNVMIGYYENEEATAAAIDKHGFYHTGDLGYIDKNGFIIITGRKKNVIVNKNGKNIFPEEIEALISENPLISEVIVFGDDNGQGDILITAEVRPDMEVLEKTLGKNPSAEEIQKLLDTEVKKVNQQLSSYKAVRKVLYREEEFEKTTSKKIKRSYKV